MLTYIRPYSVSPFLGIAAAIPMLFSCGSDDDLTAPTDGTVQVTTTTSGAEQDFDGYTVSLAGSTPQPIGTVDTVTFTEIEPGDHTVVLAGVAPNCAVGFGLQQRVVTVIVGDTVNVPFTITCESSEPPPDGGGGDPPVP